MALSKQPGLHSLVAALKASCSSASCSAEKGGILHAHIVEAGLESHLHLSTTLIHMYCKRGRLRDAEDVFRHVPAKNVFSWTSLICGHSHAGHGHAALRLYARMLQHGVEPSYVTLVGVLKACAASASPRTGRACHAQIAQGEHATMMGFDAIRSTLVDMYAKCGALEDARWVFGAAPECDRTRVSWTALIAGYARARCDNNHNDDGANKQEEEEEEEEEAFHLFQQMQHEGIGACPVALVGILGACSNARALARGKRVHARIAASPRERDDALVANALLHMYVKCGSLAEARGLFEGSKARDVVTWSTMMAGYAAQEGCADEVLSLLARAEKEEGVEPDDVMFGSVLKACSRAADLHHGRLLHSRMLRDGRVAPEAFVAASLIDMYVKCGSLEDARRAFDALKKRNVVAWSALLSGYVELGREQEAARLFEQMQEEEGVAADDVTLVCLLKACSGGACLERGRLLHEHSVGASSDENAFVANALIDLYMKCGRMRDALEVFEGLRTRNRAMWSVVIAGLAEHGYGRAALVMFHQMREEGIEPDSTTFVCVLKACSTLGALEQGKLIHAQIKREVCEADCFVASSLIDMYANCGSLAGARGAFDRLAMPNVVAWSAMIGACAENGEYDAALDCFDRMLHRGVRPVDVTYTSLLCACNRLGLVDEGCRHFQRMVSDHRITPTVDHYNCMIDLMGRLGCLRDARDISLTMPTIPSLVAWMSLLSHCRMHGYLDLASECYENVVLLDRSHASSYELMSRLYTDAGRYEEADGVQKERRRARAWKKAGIAFIEIDHQIHSFSVGGLEKSCGDDAHVRSRRLKMAMMRELGYVPHLDSAVLQRSFGCDSVEAPTSQPLESLAVMNECTP